MPSLSKIAHNKFTALIQYRLLQIDHQTGEEQTLQSKILKLEILFEQYKNNIENIHKIIKEYEEIQWNIRHCIRKVCRQAKRVSEKLPK